MNIDEIQTAKEHLEQRIHEFITRETNNFRDETGLSIESIDLNMIELSIIGEKKKKYILEEVSCRIIL